MSAHPSSRPASMRRRRLVVKQNSVIRFATSDWTVTRVDPKGPMAEGDVVYADIAYGDDMRMPVFARSTGTENAVGHAERFSATAPCQAWFHAPTFEDVRAQRDEHMAGCAECQVELADSAAPYPLPPSLQVAQRLHDILAGRTPAMTVSREPRTPEERADRVTAVARRAEDAFWRVVTASYPGAASGDLAPGPTIHVQEAMRAAVEEWVTTNVREEDR